MRDKDLPQFVEERVNEGNDTDVYHNAQTATEESDYPFLDDVPGHRGVAFVMFTFSEFDCDGLNQVTSLEGYISGGFNKGNSPHS